MFERFGLPLDEPLPSTKWKTRWSQTLAKCQKILYQCSCGTASQEHHGTKGTGRSRQLYQFVGCLAFAEIERDKITGAVIRLRGHLEHLEACKQANHLRAPTLHLNDNVRLMAENMLRLDAHTAD